MTETSYRYHKAWRLDREQGRRRLVPAEPAVAHVRRLLAAGLTKRGIAEMAGVSATTVCRLLSEPDRLVQRRVADAVLTVHLPAILARPSPEGFVPALGSRRRIQALLALGWRHADINAHLDAAGVRTRSQLVLHQAGTLLARRTADAVTAAYEALNHQPGPSAKTRTLARQAGYAPPAAWDHIDNPAERPKGVR